MNRWREIASIELKMKNWFIYSTKSRERIGKWFQTWDPFFVNAYKSMAIESIPNGWRMMVFLAFDLVTVQVLSNEKKPIELYK